MSNINKILYDNEKVLWQGKPEKYPYFVGRAFACIPIFFFGLFFAAIPLVMAIASVHSGHKAGLFILLLPHFWIGVGLMFGPYTVAYFSYSRIAYAITDKRVLIESGFITLNITSIEYSMIANTDVQVSAVDNWFGGNTGTIIISSTGIQLGNIPKSATKLYHILNPYAVFKFFEKLELDVKTDQKYPNALRPADNPGYGTQIKPDMSGVSPSRSSQ